MFLMNFWYTEQMNKLSKKTNNNKTIKTYFTGYIQTF